MFEKLFGSFAVAGFTKDAEKLLSICRSYGPQERGQLFASTKIALAFLVLDRELEKNGSIVLALEAMDAGRHLSKTEIGQLSKYNLRLMELQAQAYKSHSPINNLIASGLPVWITSVRALGSLPLQPYVRELWSLLEGGDQLAAYDAVDRVVGQLGGHPLAEQIQRSRHMTTPEIFVAR